MVTLFFAVKPTLAIMFLRCSCSHVLLIVVHLIVNSVLYKSWSDDDYVGNGPRFVCIETRPRVLAG